MYNSGSTLSVSKRLYLLSFLLMLGNKILKTKTIIENTNTGISIVYTFFYIFNRSLTILLFFKC